MEQITEDICRKIHVSELTEAEREILFTYMEVRFPSRRHCREEQRKKNRYGSSQVKKNRNRALGINSAYAVFLSVAAVLAVFICVFYLRLQSDIVNQAETITALQEELNMLTEENDTAYQAAEDSVDLEEVRRKAVNELGMVYAAQGSVVEYESPAEDYVKQYSEIPENGILAKSGDAEQ